MEQVLQLCMDLLNSGLEELAKLTKLNCGTRTVSIALQVTAAKVISVVVMKH